MYKRILLSTLSLLAVIAALGAQAQPFGGPRGPMAFSSLDLDGDGYVSSQEFSQHRDARMAERKAQGRLLRNVGQAPRFEKWDTDGDGRLSSAELMAGQEARYAARIADRRPCWRNR